jgi:pimeloyl-ACP methyl ester carboxylesterase
MSALETLMPTARFVETNGVRLAYYEVGPKSGVPVIFCHGFPELAFSWRHQLAALAAAGRWGIALDQRGYGLSSLRRRHWPDGPPRRPEGDPVRP